MHARGIRADVEEVDFLVAVQVAADLKIRMSAVEESEGEVSTYFDAVTAG